MIRKYHLAKLAMEGHLEAIQKDEKVYGAIPADIQKAMGYSSVNGNLAPNTQPEVQLWGTGSPRREFLHVDDMASASVHVMNLPQTNFEGEQPSFLNVGTGLDITIEETARIIAKLVGFKGQTVFNPVQPDGTPRKLMDTSRMNSLGWAPSMSLSDGLEDAYRWYAVKLLSVS
jgi:GDP-L-fucose synthase